MPDPKQMPPSEEKLRLYLMQGPEMLEVVKLQIEKFKLPYIILEAPDGSLILRQKYTRGEQWLMKFVTVDQETIEMKQDAALMSDSEHPVLIVGDTGTGKELIAKSQIGKREGKLLTINCAGLPRELIESELFGHLSGAFTGAQRTKEGILTAAKDGLVFMDEIGELPLDVQAKLLRAIQYKEIRKVGSNAEEGISCKFAFATNRNLKQMVKLSQFREDLFARINILSLHIKPLKERQCDIIPIVKSLQHGDEFLQRYEEELKDGLFDLSMNVRSLESLVIRYKVLGRVKVER